MELKTLDYFSCVTSFDLGVFGPYFPKLSSDDLGIRVRPNLMINEELKSLDYFSCVPVHDLRYSGPVCPNCPNTRVPVKQV